MGSFTVLNMIVVAVMLAGVTLGGHLLSGHAKSSRSFFTAEGGLPWWAVAASLYATVVSAVTFISLPAMVYAPGADLAFFQLIIGLVIGKVLAAILFARAYYESKSVDTVYDYLSIRLSKTVSKSTMGLQILLLVAQNSIVVVSAALVLNVLTDISLPVSCVIIVGFAILWSWMGGLSTVVWTDAMLFGVFLFGAVLSAVLTFVATDLSFTEALRELDQQAKLNILDLSLDPKKSFTLWAGLITGALISLVPVSSQAGMQRIRACRSANDAKKAFIFSSLFLITPVLLMAVGLGLALFYGVQGVPPELAERLATQPDQVFPYFIIHEIPDGVSGIFVAAVFAAAISTLDSRLAELADVTVTNIYRPYMKTNGSEAHYLRVARLLLIGWGVLFCIFSIILTQVDGQSLFDLTLMATNTFGGPILGMFFLARFNIGTPLSAALGVVVSVSASMWMYSQDITHYWWFPVSVIIIMAFGFIASRKNFDKDGVIQAGETA